jgi:hypothetical protein
VCAWDIAYAIDMAVTNSPNISTIVLRNSPGGDIPTGYRLGELFRLEGPREFTIRRAKVAKIAKPTVETSVKVRQNLEKFVWSSREK